MHIKEQVAEYNPESEAKAFRPEYIKGIGHFTRNPAARCYTIVSFVRRKHEKGNASVRDSECVPEAEFIFTPSDDFYILMAVSPRIAAFAKANKMQLELEEWTGHFFMSCADFEKLRDEFLGAPERMLVYESIAAAGIVDARSSPKHRAN